MRTIILLFALITMMIGPVRAQSLPSNGKDPAWVMINDSIVGVLVLTVDQHERLERMEKHYQKDYDKLLAVQDTLTEEQMKSGMHALSANRQKEIKAIMTPKQFDQWIALLKRQEDADARNAALKK